MATRQLIAAFLFRFIGDRSGNTLAIAAAALLPIMALVGGGVDIARAYMAKTQLQSACDAGVLAGRRAMSVSGVFGEAERAKAQRMFDFNFNPASVDATGTEFATDDTEAGEVTGTASTVMPTVIMTIFGKETIALSAACMAELQIANADVMFVLDTTGSMAGSRIAGLREAVRDFHRSMNEAVREDGTRIRYGFVPYSMTVNATDLIAEGDMPLDFFNEVAPYTGREALFNTVYHMPTEAFQGETEQTYASAISRDECYDYGDNDYPSNGSNPRTTGSAPGNVNTYEYDYVSWVKTGTRGNGWNRVDIGTCVRSVAHTLTTYQAKFRFTRWRTVRRNRDVSEVLAFGAVPVGADITGAVADQAGWYDEVTLAKNNGVTLDLDVTLANAGIEEHIWGGCIEERDTVTDATWDPIPDGAFDLDIDLEPESEETRWRPYFGPYVSETENCPAPMQLFREVELSDDPEDIPEWLETYVTNLVPRGNTYHDIGMIWGGRLASSRGIFADNVNEGDNRSVSRHVIFMTDGDMDPDIYGYNAYGIESLDNRVAPSGSGDATVKARHTARFRAACEQVKAQGMTLWVIAFGTGLTNDLRSCASDGRAYRSNNTTELRNTFKFIASQVADLRLGA